jgi:hypothetical protein
VGTAPPHLTRFRMVSPLSSNPPPSSPPPVSDDVSGSSPLQSGSPLQSAAAALLSARSTQAHRIAALARRRHRPVATFVDLCVGLFCISPVAILVSIIIIAPNAFISWRAYDPGAAAAAASIIIPNITNATIGNFTNSSAGPLPPSNSTGGGGAAATSAALSLFLFIGSRVAIGLILLLAMGMSVYVRQRRGVGLLGGTGAGTDDVAPDPAGNTNPRTGGAVSTRTDIEARAAIAELSAAIAEAERAAAMLGPRQFALVFVQPGMTSAHAPVVSVGGPRGRRAAAAAAADDDPGGGGRTSAAADDPDDPSVDPDILLATSVSLLSTATGPLPFPVVLRLLPAAGECPVCADDSATLCALGGCSHALCLACVGKVMRCPFCRAAVTSYRGGVVVGGEESGDGVRAHLL